MTSASGRSRLTLALSVLLCGFTLVEVNYARLGPQAQLAVFTGLGLVLCFLGVPMTRGGAPSRLVRAADVALALIALACCAYVVWQTEPAFAGSWWDGRSLGNRAGYETSMDILVGALGLLLVLEAARRTLGWALPLLAAFFLLYAYFGAWSPDWFFPHRGYPADRIVAQSFLHSQGVFGVALSVMFTYVFLFVVFGALLGATGATRFVIDFAARTFGRTPGGPAKVAVISSGMMGSLSGSAVANTVATGTFTIPMMRSAGFPAYMAGGIEAAASSGGALAPPVMGAGAYMMLELIQPPVTYLEIVRAAAIPAVLYYLSLFFIVHFSARRLAIGAGGGAGLPAVERGHAFEGVVFGVALLSLIAFLVLGYTAFRAVSIALLVTTVTSFLHPRTRLNWAKLRAAIVQSARDAVPLVAAAACVGIVIAVVTMTGIGTRLPAAILPLAEENLFLALALIMVSSLVLGMGLPSAVVYLLLATLVGPVLGQLGVVPLAAHLFIFYFGMMAMVTPPVALAAYAAASVAGSEIMKTSWAAFRFALVGFTLPYIFIYRPELLLLSVEGHLPPLFDIAAAIGIAVAGILLFAGAIAGFLFSRTPAVERALFFVASALMLAPGPTVIVLGMHVHLLDASGVLLAIPLLVSNWRRGRPA